MKSLKLMHMALRSLAVLATALVLSTSQDVGRAMAAPDAQLVKIDAGGLGPQARRLVLPLHKAAIVELPVAARDVLVSNPAVVDAVVRTPKRTYLIGMETGQTNAFFFDGKGDQILNLEIVVERDVKNLEAALEKYLPSARVTVEAINNHIVLSGSVPNASQSSQAREIAARFVGDEKNVLNMLAIESKEQVMLKVTVAEMQRTLIKQLGIDVTSQVELGDLLLSWATQNNFSLQGQSLGGLTSTPPGLSPTGASDGGATFDSYLVQLGLQALERAGLLRTLAEPTLTAISGESAKFLAGGEFPVPTSRDRDGNITLEFKPFGVGLGFTPVVLSEGRISMKISTEVSELTSEGAFVSQGGTVTDEDGNVIQVPGVTIPALRVRRAETTMELPSGGSLVMAGLISESTRQNIDGVPGVKDVPVLGTLFRSRDYLNNETELVVIVTPYLVDATSRDKLALPTDGFTPASDADTILMGRLNATYGVEGAEGVSEGKLEGPVGFVLD
ncbi:type II and III secretion system protein [Tepidicaulis marinus]|uniref:Type II and III secretion system protein n=1 Tax=Tepidicaulis marinus TaxID=1333998 RepID=A0A081BBB7_9HYPH|nr:type II and III secretion system protein family protein [Tepidicaulis marinus]GAK45335.1 type II and III secretion system protein [Tepidicaulis marinus]